MSSCRNNGHELLIQQNKVKLCSMMQSEIKRYLKNIAASRDTLQYNLTIFMSEKEIWPDQCSYAITCLNSTRAIWHKQCQLFDEISPALLSTSLDSSINRLTVMFHYIYQQNSQLINLITAFRTICLTSSKQKRKKRQEIARKFDLLMKNSDELIQDILDLLQEARQEKFLSLSLNQEVADEPGKCVEEEVLPVNGEVCDLPNKSRQVRHLIVVGRDYKGYKGYVKDSDNTEHLSKQSAVSSDKEPLEV